MTNKNSSDTSDEKRSWYEKNAPFIYGIAVFTVLIVFGLLHGLAIN